MSPRLTPLFHRNLLTTGYLNLEKSMCLTPDAQFDLFKTPLKFDVGLTK